MLLGVAVSCRAVNAEANAVIGFSEILEEVKGGAALPRLKVDLLSAANHNFFHARMLNRTGLSRSLLTRSRFSSHALSHSLRRKSERDCVNVYGGCYR